ncbi:MAG: tyrosine recombinase [Actinobacteria bacterium]|jgi:integrase/recombinase XerD|nr:tyrosine recombinase [Actinomycetota bacterium]
MDIHTLNSFIDYLRVEKGAAANTIAAYRRDLTRYLNWRVNNPESPIKEYAFSLKDLAPSSLERNYSAVRSFHKYLNREFNISDPTDDLPETGKRQRLPKALTVEEITKLIEAGKDPSQSISLRDYLLLELLYSTGARVSEVVGINLSDISENVVNGESIWVLKLRGKGGKERIVPLGTYAKSAIDDYLVRTRPSLLKKLNENALFLNNRGTRLSRVSAWEIVKSAAEKSGLTSKVTPHVFRHSYATHLLDGGADIRVVQELLGHASVTTTQIYTLITIDKVRESYRLAHPRA